MVNVKYPLGLVLAALITACPVSGNRECGITITNADKKAVAIRVEIADTDRLRSKGLMFRREMGRDHGMLFVFDEDRKQNFWMKNTFLPLSIAYIDTGGIINEIYDMKPLDISVTYPSVKPARYALEMNQGWFKKNNITSGCRIVLDGCVGK